MTAELGESRTFRLSQRLTVELTVSGIGITAEWQPGLPAKLTTKEMRRYRQARDSMLQRLADRTGGVVAVLEA
jgi:hypothetical protein